MQKKLYCVTCKTIKNLLPNPYSKVKNRQGEVVGYYMCRNCHAERRRRYYKTLSGRKMIDRSKNNYGIKNPERKKAWGIANYRIKSTHPCEVCGAFKVHMHHPDPLRPMLVQFLCPLHHKQEHMLQS